jgi:dienelactone hydrolase
VPALLPRAASALVLLALLIGVADAQPKKVLTHADYDAWNKESGVTLSPDGKYVAYVVAPLDGRDAEVILRHIASGKDVKAPRGGNSETSGITGSPQFAPNSARVVFPLSPTKAEVEKAKAAKVKPEEMPKPVLAVMTTATGEITAKLPYEKGYTVGGEGAGLLIYRKPVPEAKDEEKKEPARPVVAKKKVGGSAEAPAPRAGRTYGTPLTIRDLATGAERTLPDVAEYELSKDGKLLVYTVASKKEEANGVFALDPASQGNPIILKSGEGRYSRLTWDDKQTKLAFFYDSAGVNANPKIAPPPRPAGTPVGTAAPLPPPRWHVYVWERNGKVMTKVNLPLAPGGFGALIGAAAAANAQSTSPATEVFNPETPGQKPGWVLNGSTLSFNRDGTRLHLATTIKRDDPPPAAPAGPDKVEMDLWHWKDAYIQPMQKIRGDLDRTRSYSAVLFLDSKQFQQVSDESLQVGLPDIGDWALGSDDRKYLHLTGYVSRLPRDFTMVNVATGDRKPLLQNFPGMVYRSPTGKFLLTFDGKDWNSIAIADGKKTNLTAKLKVKFFDEENDLPDTPPAYGLEGWTTDGNFALVYDRFDLWKLAADGSSAENLTKIGREQNLHFRLVDVRTFEEAERGIDVTKPMLFAVQNVKSHDTGFFRLETGGSPKLLVMGARRHGTPVKAKHADTYLLTVESFYDYPDYFAAGPDFHELRRVTNINPQIRRYNWGRAELVHYTSTDGVPLSGILVKPENFDPAKTYPMVVYIYERLSQNVNRFTVPNVTRGQVINPTFYASNGYLVLMPDIAYKVGSPGQSAVKCILPAIQAVADKGFVDEKAIGINGQSWGGYQIAYLITQTNRFKAAAAGAVVSDMVSAYGGIRWGTGLPRQFQYEKTQSRIGDTLWKAPMRYIENSPIFMADRVETPLLMIHNDGDDAVPWYQGIEYFLALRRLGKECYMLNYNGEPHNLAKKANARDFAVRMFQFFEHHLKGKPAPEWMIKGVPYVDRDREKETIREQLKKGTER